MEYGFFVRGQYRQGDDMAARFKELMEQVRLADKLGFADLISGMHYAGYPLSQFQLMPFLSRAIAETPNMRIVTGIILLSLHKPLDIAESLATMDVLSGGKVIFGSALGYREVEFLAFGTSQKERVRRFEENLIAIRRAGADQIITYHARDALSGGWL